MKFNFKKELERTIEGLDKSKVKIEYNVIVGGYTSDGAGDSDAWGTFETRKGQVGVQAVR